MSGSLVRAHLGVLIGNERLLGRGQIPHAAGPQDLRTAEVVRAHRVVNGVPAGALWPRVRVEGRQLGVALAPPVLVLVQLHAQLTLCQLIQGVAFVAVAQFPVGKVNQLLGDLGVHHHARVVLPEDLGQQVRAARGHHAHIVGCVEQDHQSVGVVEQVLDVAEAQLRREKPLVEPVKRAHTDQGWRHVPRPEGKCLRVHRVEVHHSSTDRPEVGSSYASTPGTLKPPFISLARFSSSLVSSTQNSAGIRGRST